MKDINKESFSRLLNNEEAPSLSLYMTTHKKYPENEQDVIRFKNLVKKLETTLLEDQPKDESKKLLEPFEELMNDKNFWKHSADGLAVFANSSTFESFRIHDPVMEMAVVKDKFHLKPLRQYLQNGHRYYVLGLSLHEIKLYEGNRDTVWQIELPEDVSTTIEEALGSQLTEKHSTVASYGGVGGKSTTMHHGHGGKKEEDDKDAERFFRVVAKEMDAYLADASAMPIVLAALPEHHHLYRKVSHNNSLLAEGIELNPNALTPEKLGSLASTIVEKNTAMGYEKLAEKYNQAKADKLGSDDPEEILEAAQAGRVETLVLQDGNNSGGALSNDKGDSETAENSDDRIDEISDTVLKMGGEVQIMPGENMPGGKSCAAIYRY